MSTLSIFALLVLCVPFYPALVLVLPFGALILLLLNPDTLVSLVPYLGRRRGVGLQVGEPTDPAGVIAQTAARKSLIRAAWRAASVAAPPQGMDTAGSSSCRRAGAVPGASTALPNQRPLASHISAMTGPRWLLPSAPLPCQHWCQNGREECRCRAYYVL